MTRGIYAIVRNQETAQQIAEYLEDEDYVFLGYETSGKDSLAQCAEILPQVVMVERGIRDMITLEIIKELKRIDHSINLLTLVQDLG